MNITISLVSRLIFDFAFYWKKHHNASEIEVPFLLVYEEAHSYIPKSNVAKFKSVKQAVERIAKEGRKYGVSAMIVSQRPSEISETIFSQCNNFVVMRLTNPTDQQYVAKLLPDSVSSITESLPSFQQREALVLGDSIALPTIVKIDETKPLPNSNDIKFMEKWKNSWDNIVEFDNIIQLMSK